MIEAIGNITGRISSVQSIKGKINNPIVIEYPELEDLEVTPTTEEQIFKSSKYGFNEVKVKGVESEEINIIPSAEEQVKEGLYNKVTVAGDENLIADNIKEGTSIFGVEGNAKTTSAKITDASYLFYEGVRTDYVQEILSLCEDVTNIQRMFAGYRSLTSLDLSSFDTSKVKDMNRAFYDCRNLTELDVSNFNTRNVTNMTYMFYRCENLLELDLSSFDTSNVTDMSSMFNLNGNLKKIDIRNFTFDKVTSYSYIFGGVPSNCEIIVKSGTEKEWVLARRSDLTNVKTVAELEV